MKQGIIFAALLAFFAAAPLPRAARAEKETPPPLSFEPLPIPATGAEKNAIRISPKAVTFCCGGKREERPLEYRVLLRSGMTDKHGQIAGLVTGADGLPLKRPDGSPYVSNSPAGNGLITAGGGHYLFTQFDDVPGAVSLSALEADKEGNFSVKEFAPVELSGVGGTAGNSGGGKTPWGTHLAAEGDYWLDAYWFTPAAASYSFRHIKHCRKTETVPPEDPDLPAWCAAVESVRGYLGNPEAFSPYRYGYTIELTVNRNGAPSVKDGTKHLAMGRTVPAMTLAMPDRRTVYMTGNGAYAGFFMFTADDRSDLSSGTLYIAKWRQQPRGADIKWVPLGHATDKEIGAILGLRTEFADIFDVGDPLVCPAGYRIIKAGPSGVNCLRLRDGKNGSAIAAKFGTRISPLTAAAFLEPGRYGALLGGATEWNDAKGLAYDDDHNALYMAVGGITGGMTSNLDPVDDIRMPKNVCGGVLRFKLGETRDTVGNKIKSTYIAIWAELAAEGTPLSPGLPFADENGCHPDFIAGAHDVQYIGHNVLLIGEDGSQHFNNYAWAYDVERKMLTRIASAPPGGGINGFATLDAMDRFYLFMNVRHPLGNAALNAEGKQANGPLLDNATDQQRKGYIGYISGLPSLAR